MSSIVSLETINELVAGSAGGAAQVIVGQPLDTIKTRAQIAPSEVFLFHRIIPNQQERV
jgi:solute carrier family 25 (mitochondrial carnitine/acylcarnitine transporter), member 20/29